MHFFYKISRFLLPVIVGGAESGVAAALASLDNDTSGPLVVGLEAWKEKIFKKKYIYIIFYSNKKHN